MAARFKKMNPFLFWQKWLFNSSLLFAFAAIVFAFCGRSLLFMPYDKMIARVLWHSSQFPAEAEQFRAFIYGPLGGTIACCYILLAFITKYALKKNNDGHAMLLSQPSAFGLLSIRAYAFILGHIHRYTSSMLFL